MTTGKETKSLGLGSLVRDEQGNFSTARVAFWVWTAASLYLVLWHWATIGNVVLAFMSGVELALIGWAAGPRIAQYLLPQIGGLAGAIAQGRRGQDGTGAAAQSPVVVAGGSTVVAGTAQSRRDVDNGWEPTHD